MADARPLCNSLEIIALLMKLLNYYCKTWQIVTPTTQGAYHIIWHISVLGYGQINLDIIPRVTPMGHLKNEISQKHFNQIANEQIILQTNRYGMANGFYAVSCPFELMLSAIYPYSNELPTPNHCCVIRLNKVNSVMVVVDGYYLNYHYSCCTLFLSTA